jgi:hypothetical protein
VHEGCGLSEVGSCRSRFEALRAVREFDEAFRPPGDFGKSFGAIVGNEGVERCFDGGHGADLFDQSVADFDSCLVVDRAAFCVEHRARGDVALIVGKLLHLTSREGSDEVINNGFFAVAVYVERGGARRRFPSVFHDFTPDIMRVRESVRRRVRPAFERQ